MSTSHSDLFFDVHTITDHIANLREDAAATQPIALPSLPEAGPVAALSAAVHAAVAAINEHTDLLAREAHRTAANMEAFTTGALRVDTSTARVLEGVAP